MFVVLIKYKKPLTEIDKYLVEHRAFLQQGYDKNFFIVSGPQNPRIGGVIISQLTSRDEIESILREDPFYKHDIAEYEFIEFNPVKYHDKFSSFVES